MKYHITEAITPEIWRSASKGIFKDVDKKYIDFCFTQMKELAPRNSKKLLFTKILAMCRLYNAMKPNIKNWNEQMEYQFIFDDTEVLLTIVIGSILQKQNHRLQSKIAEYMVKMKTLLFEDSVIHAVNQSFIEINEGSFQTDLAKLFKDLYRFEPMLIYFIDHKLNNMIVSPDQREIIVLQRMVFNGIEDNLNKNLQNLKLMSEKDLFIKILKETRESLVDIKLPYDETFNKPEIQVFEFLYENFSELYFLASKTDLKGPKIYKEYYYLYEAFKPVTVIDSMILEIFTHNCKMFLELSVYQNFVKKIKLSTAYGNMNTSDSIYEKKDRE